MLKQPVVRAAVLGAALLISATAFYVIAPVFVREAPVSGYPTLAYLPTRTPEPPTATPTDTPIPTETPAVETRLFASGEAALVLRGSFYSVVHVGQGQASLYGNSAGVFTLALENFQVEDGPDLHVYLAAEDPVGTEHEGQDLAGAIDLGALLAVSGDQTYELPAGIDLAHYRSVVIWCVPFQVPFIAAPLSDLP
jgi:hypothetical protein